MNKVIKMIILIILSCSVYFIYQHTKNSIINITSIGDTLSMGFNSYGIKEYGYIDYYKDYLNRENEKVNIVNDYSKRDLSITNLLEQSMNDPKFKKELSESTTVILTVGYNDLLYKLSLQESINEKVLNQIIIEISTDYKNLITEMRKYYKREIIVIGYYASNKNDYYLNKGIRKLNQILSSSNEVDYIDTYNLLSNRNLYFSHPNTNYPNRAGYQAISKKIITKTLEKKENIWYINNAFNYYDK